MNKGTEYIESKRCSLIILVTVDQPHSQTVQDLTVSRCSSAELQHE